MTGRELVPCHQRQEILNSHTLESISNPHRISFSHSSSIKQDKSSENALNHPRPHIQIILKNFRFKALLDLGATVNLYSKELIDFLKLPATY